MNYGTHLLAALIGVGLGVGLAFVLNAEDEANAPSSATPPFSPRGTFDEDALMSAQAIVVGGGADPSSSQISLVQDLRLARDRFREAGLRTAVLFGAGDGSPVARIGREPEGLRAELADFFDPRERGVEFVAADLRADGPADAGLLLELLDRRAEAPLTLFIAAHGERGEQSSENLVQLWGDTAFGPVDLAEAAGSNTRLVLTSCYGGAFAAAALRNADPIQPEATGLCGFFATEWDREASGCDPNPERAQQEGYAIHFFEALASRDRQGQSIDVDLDGDGVVSLLEAHTRARIADRSFDVPTTTSEYYLRSVAKDEARNAEPIEDVFETAVIDVLSAQLSMDEDALVAALDADERAMAALEASLEEVGAELDAAFYALRVELLARWPVLDDPWHPTHQALLEGSAADIEAVLRESELARHFADTASRQQVLAERWSEQQVRRARLLTLRRAYETRRLAGVLRAADDARWQRYQTLRACEHAPL